MAIRDTLNSLVSRPAARIVESPVREIVADILASRTFATPEDVATLRKDIEALRASGASESTTRIAGLEQEIASLKKKLNMAMGALQAANAQLTDLKRVADEASGTARQAAQQATSAATTAEAAIEGAEGLEVQMDHLASRISATPSPKPRTRKPKAG